MSAPRLRTRGELRRDRRPRRHSCWDQLFAAPLWPLHGANLGTLLRTRDAVGACLAVPRLPWVPEAPARGNTLRRPACVHWVGRDVTGWMDAQRAAGSPVVGVELTDESVRLADLPAARRRTVMLLGHEQTGIPPEGLDRVDVAVEFPLVEFFWWAVDPASTSPSRGPWCCTGWPGCCERERRV